MSQTLSTNTETLSCEILHAASGPADKKRRRRPKCMAVVALVMTLAAGGGMANAQQSKSIPRIGFLSRDLHPSDSRGSSTLTLDAFREGLQKLGYVEGKSIFIESRYAEGRFERLPALAEELIRLNVDVILADAAASARAVKKLSSTIPIMIASAGNPIQDGLVASLARPSENVTGFTNLTSELIGKRFELLKEVVPKVSRFAFLDDDDNSGLLMPHVKNAQTAAQSLGARLERVEVKTANPDIDGAFRFMVKERIGALITSTSFLGSTLYRKKILQLAEQNRIPAIHASSQWMDDGGLMYYGSERTDLYRRAATYVDKILKGAKPADLPVEQPIKFDLVINLKAAKQIGLTIPPNVLVRANRVIR
jgi:putative ABC transport system substrate-binding protein